MEKENLKNKKRFRITYGAIVIVSVILIMIFIMLFLNKPNQYEVAFNSNGGSKVEVIIAEENKTIQEPEKPIKEGYVFAGWYYNNELFDFSAPITSDVTLEARWTKIDQSVKVTGIKLDKSKLTLKIGDKVKINATIIPENATIKELKWNSSNSNVVSVDSKGNIKALKKGTAVITVTTKDGEFTAKLNVTVVDKKQENTTNNSKPAEKPQEPVVETIKVTGVTLNKTNVNIYVNENIKLTANIKPNNASNKKLIWKSSDSTVATVDSNGTVKGLKVGTATITVTTQDGNHTATCIVKVSKKPDTYVVTFTAKQMEGTGAVMQYPVTVTKNGSSCSYKFIIYNGTKVVGNLSAEKCNKAVKSATIRLTDGTDVTASVKYN